MACWREGNNIPESDLKASYSYLFVIRYFKEWLFSELLSALSSLLFHFVLGCFLEQDPYSLSYCHP